MVTFAIPDFPTARNKVTKPLHDFIRPLAKLNGMKPAEIHSIIWVSIVQNIEARIHPEDQFDSHISCTEISITPECYRVEMTVRTHGKYQVGTFLFPAAKRMTHDWRAVNEPRDTKPLFVMYAPEPAPVTDIDFGPDQTKK